MKAITLRKVPNEVAKKIERKAHEFHVSMNKAVIQLLEESLGTGAGAKRKTVYRDLDHLAGRWLKQEANLFRKHMIKSRRTDQELWR